MTWASPSTALRGAAATAAHATLTPHLMLDPPLPRRGRDDTAQGGLFDVDVGTVWKTARAAEGGDTLLTVRCFSVEGLQLRLAQLVNGHAGVLSPSLAMFLRGGLDQAYVDALAYRRLVDAAPRVLGDLGAHPLHVDTLSRRLVVDTSRCFVAKTARLTAEAIAGLAALSESPQCLTVVKRLRCALGATASEAEVALATRALLEAARRVARHVLNEPGLELGETAEPLAREVGPRLVARALFTGAEGDTGAVAAAFAARWKTGAPPLPKD